MGNYMKSPVYKQRLMGTGYVPMDVDAAIQQRLNAVQGSKLVKVDGQSTALIPGQVRVNPTDGSEEEVGSHEYAHKAGASVISKGRLLNLNPNEIGLLSSKNRQAQATNHLGKPAEAKADIDALRFMMENHFLGTPMEPMTPERLNKAKEHPAIKSSTILQRLNQRYSDKDLIDLMNILASRQNQTSTLT